MLQGRRGESSVAPIDSAKHQEDIRPRLRAVPPVHRRTSYERWAKPLIDRLGGVVLSILTFPIIALVVPLIWWRMGRPAIFRQRRVGRQGREFTVYKLRTMRPDRRVTEMPFRGKDRRVNHKSPDDPRHTPLGRALRRWSIDELPQFWNVAMGQMSLVGPRPELPSVVNQYQDWQHRRHDVKPGVTGLWQISARGDRPMHLATDIDIKYVETIGFITDLKVLALTIPAALGANKGH
jgi:lipopolysaccharide/colanic/teichoic acid biosynthesis glycosyltransferase